MTTEAITIQVNGEYRKIEGVELETPLLYVLRNEFGLTAAKFACGLEQCGACKVIIDGEAVPSCQKPVGEVVGCNIETLEGMGTADALHPLQEAFMAEQAFQCGFCTAGMLTSGKALLDQNPDPSDEEIKVALQRNLCRCGTYPRVVRAVKRAAGQPYDPPIEVKQQTPLAVRDSGSLPAVLVSSSAIDDWVQFNVDGTVTLFTGKVEIGQGIKTAVAQIGAEELDVDIDRVIVVTADTAHTPNEGRTVGSMSVETTGRAMRQAAAEARQVLLDLAFEELEAQTPAAELEVENGVIRDPVTSRYTTYWRLLNGRKFEREMTGKARPKGAAQHRVVGQPVPQVDTVGKVTGQFQYVHDLALPDMVHARVLRPPSYEAQLVDLDEAAIVALPGVLKVVRDGRFVAVIAEKEVQAVRALAELREHVEWAVDDSLLPDEGGLYNQLRTQPNQTFVLEEAVPVAKIVPEKVAAESAATTIAATYNKPYTMHGSLGPSAAVAQLTEDDLTVWTHSQGVFPTRDIIAPIVGVPVEKIRVVHYEGAGCYGHNGADDAALDAALLALHVPNRPVSLKWMRGDEHQWEPYGPAMSMDIEASVDEEGQIVAWNFEGWSYPHLGRGLPSEKESGLVGAWHVAEARTRPEPRVSLWPHVGGHRNLEPLYTLPNKREVFHFVPDSPLRTSTLRALGAFGNVFAIESMMDELAHVAGIDPLEFRLRHLWDERARAVLEAAAEQADWGSSMPEGSGRGLAFARYKNKQCYAAVVVEVQVEDAQIRLLKGTIAADAGQVVNPDGLANQLEGGFVQAASWALREQVRFDRQAVTSVDWETYPILRMPEAPEVKVVLLNRPEQPFLGSGEATAGPTPAAIANAVFDAVGVRLREIPLKLS